MQREHVKLPESETDNPVFKSDDFRMYCFKVRGNLAAAELGCKCAVVAEIVAELPPLHLLAAALLMPALTRLCRADCAMQQEVLPRLGHLPFGSSR